MLIVASRASGDSGLGRGPGCGRLAERLDGSRQGKNPQGLGTGGPAGSRANKGLVCSPANTLSILWWVSCSDPFLS